MNKTAAKRLPSRERLFAEHHPVGTFLLWPENPVVRDGPYQKLAPGRHGVVAWEMDGVVFARFYVGGRLSEPVEVVTGQPCKEDSK